MSKDLSSKMRIQSAETEMVDNTFLPSIGQQIGGLSMFSNVFKRGRGNSVFGSDENGIWLGSADFLNAPFRVYMNGAIYASSATFPNIILISIFKQDAIPTSLKIGDLWFDTNDNNKLYRAASVGADEIKAGEWELVQDLGIGAAQSTADGAQSAAESAQTTADSKIVVFAQNAIPTSVSVGDLWYDTDDNNKPYRAASIGANEIKSGEWEAVQDLRAADALLKAGSSQSLTGDIQVGGSNVVIDGANGRILINDGVNNRIVIGNV